MTTQHLERLCQLATQLAETLMTAVICVDEIRTALQVQAKHFDVKRDNKTFDGNGRTTAQRPLLDESTFSVTWHDKSLRLGHTRLFWVLNRLARQPNQYVTHLELIQEVWDDEDIATATIRSVVRQLRSRLRDCGMEDLAAAIRGHKGHYILAF